MTCNAQQVIKVQESKKQLAGLLLTPYDQPRDDQNIAYLQVGGSFLISWISSATDKSQHLRSLM